MHRLAFATLLLVGPALGAQSLSQRVAAQDGAVQVIYPSRSEACGDGQTFVGNVFGQSTYYSGNSNFSGRGDWTSGHPCVHGPARAMVTVMSGEVTRIRAYVGPIPTSNIKTIQATAAEASAWLSDIVARSGGKAAAEAMLPLVLVDTADPWPLFLRMARDENRPLTVRRSAMTWLASGVNEKLGIADERGDTDDDEMGKQAVFALSQRPKSESVPELIEAVKTSKRPSVRRSAVFWLGQTGDRRAADLYAELLKLR
jgi:hypothetical protein